jgi:serine/threonine protein kinase
MENKPLAVGTVLKGRYQVTRLVAGGGMAWVYEVEETRRDGSRQVWAMKELRADADDTHSLEEGRQLFEQEANILVHLSHPNLPKVVAFFDDVVPGSPAARSYLVMEFIHGESLEKRLERANAPILEAQALEWAIQICDVLAYLHTRPTPVIFRDMKPSNVMVTLECSVKLIDFGIARTYKVGKRKDTITMGSENYAAPEQWGKAQTDPRADIYGLGATLYHLLTNVPPLPAFVPTPRVPIQQYNPAVSDATVALVEKALSKDREQRFASADALRLALLDCLPKRDRVRVLAERARAATETPSQPALVATVERPAVVGPTPLVPGGGSAYDAAAMPGTGTTPEPAYTKGCPQCGTMNRAPARFCRHCGYVFAQPLPPVLRVVRPEGARWEYPLRSADTLIGRPGGGQPVDLDLSFYDADGYVSRNHARVTVSQRRYAVTDLGSANGTFVNGVALAPNVPCWLRDGDRIRMGRIVLHFHIR